MRYEQGNREKMRNMWMKNVKNIRKKKTKDGFLRRTNQELNELWHKPKISKKKKKNKD